MLKRVKKIGRKNATGILATSFEPDFSDNTLDDVPPVTTNTTNKYFASRRSSVRNIEENATPQASVEEEGRMVRRGSHSSLEHLEENIKNMNIQPERPSSSASHQPPQQRPSSSASHQPPQPAGRSHRRNPSDPHHREVPTRGNLSNSYNDHHRIQTGETRSAVAPDMNHRGSDVNHHVPPPDRRNSGDPYNPYNIPPGRRNSGDPYNNIPPDRRNSGDPYNNILPDRRNSGDPYNNIPPDRRNSGDPYNNIPPDRRNSGDPYIHEPKPVRRTTMDMSSGVNNMDGPKPGRRPTMDMSGGSINMDGPTPVRRSTMDMSSGGVVDPRATPIEMNRRQSMESARRHSNECEQMPPNRRSTIGYNDYNNGVRPAHPPVSRRHTNDDSYGRAEPPVSKRHITDMGYSNTNMHANNLHQSLDFVNYDNPRGPPPAGDMYRSEPNNRHREQPAGDMYRSEPNNRHREQQPRAQRRSSTNTGYDPRSNPKPLNNSYDNYEQPNRPTPILKGSRNDKNHSLKARVDKLKKVALENANKGQWQESHDLLLEALALQNDLQHDYLEKAHTCHHLGLALNRLRRYEAALDALYDSLTLRKKYGGDQLDIAATVHTIGVVKGFSGDFEGASKNLRMAATIQKSILGRPDETTLRILKDFEMKM